MRLLLLPLSSLFGVGVALRNWFFDIGLLRTERAGVPVISVGNLSAGGVGKTPFVEFLARRLMQQGKKVAIVSRGYKREGSGMLVVSNGSVECAEAGLAGDEPAQLAAKLKGAVVIVDEQRARGAKAAREQFKVDVVLLDDGFQHRSLKRNLDLVLLPADEVERKRRLLPAGNYRESIAALRRCDGVVLTRCESREHFEKALVALRTLTDKPAMGVATRVTAVRRAQSNFSVDLNGLKGKKIVAFSGIGDAAAFEKTLHSLKWEVIRFLPYPDHHRYTVHDIGTIQKALKLAEADYLVTTEKDVFRLGAFGGTARELLNHASLFFVEIEQVVLSGEELLNEWLKLRED
ncbi:MAG: tetraacyldisaccharide 4'-kinase [Bacteroidota bacterium]